MLPALLLTGLGLGAGGVGFGGCGGCGDFVLDLLGPCEFGHLGLLDFGGVGAKFGGQLLGGEGFDDVAGLDVLEAGEVDTALDARTDFGDVVLDALERGDLALPDFLAVAQHADLCVAADEAVGDLAAGDLADLGDLEDLQDRGASSIVLLVDRVEQAVHGLGHLVLQLVDDGVHADIDVLAGGQVLRLAFRTDVEADDHRVGGRSEQDVGFRDGADARVEDLDADLFGGHAGERVGEDFDRTLHVELEDEVEVLDAGLLDLLGQAFERDAGGLGELGFALLHLAVLGNALGLVAVRHDEERVAGVGHGFQAKNFDRRRRTGLLDLFAAIVEHGADLAKGVADDVAVANFEGAVLDEDRSDC